jgi:hypothetical protein
LIDEALMNKDNVSTLADIRKKVNALMTHRPLFTW